MLEAHCALATWDGRGGESCTRSIEFAISQYLLDSASDLTGCSSSTPTLSPHNYALAMVLCRSMPLKTATRSSKRCAPMSRNLPMRFAAGDKHCMMSSCDDSLPQLLLPLTPRPSLERALRGLYQLVSTQRHHLPPSANSSKPL